MKRGGGRTLGGGSGGRRGVIVRIRQVIVERVDAGAEEELGRAVEGEAGDCVLRVAR